LGCAVLNRLTIALAVAGWGLYGFAVFGPRSPEADAQSKILQLSQAAETAGSERDTLAAELARFKDGNRDLEHVQKQIAAATQELKHLEYLRARISGEIDTMRPQPSRATSQAPTPAATPEPSVVGSLPISKDDISNAQEALTRLGYGPLKADGVFGPGTRRAIEAFQQRQGLPVTGRLEANTLRAIRDSRASVQP
jgi:murein L,D-transpeptidase YcbB/YkuD